METKTIPLKEKIENMKEGFEGCHTCDIKTSLQNLKEEIEKELNKINKLNLNLHNFHHINQNLDKAFKKHIGELE